MLDNPSFIPKPQDRGAVLVELVIVVPVLILLFTAMVDYFFIRREQFVLSEAARSAIRVTIAAAAFIPNYESEDSIQKQKEEFVKERYQRAIYLARYLVAANNLNPNGYTYNVFDVERQDPAGGSPYHTVQFNISSRDTNKRFFVFPGKSFKACVGMSGIISGTVLAATHAFSDPKPDPSCAPED